MKSTSELILTSKLSEKMYKELVLFESREEKIQYIKSLSEIEHKMLARYILANIKANLQKVEGRDYGKLNCKALIIVCTKEHYMKNALILMENVNEKTQEKVILKLLYTLQLNGLQNYIDKHKNEQTEKVMKIIRSYTCIDVQSIWHKGGVAYKNYSSKNSKYNIELNKEK